MKPLVEKIHEAMRGEIEGKPFALLGFSLGALVAFEWTRQLRRMGSEGPSHLIVLSRSAPQLPDERREPTHVIADDDEFLRAMDQRYGNVPEILKVDQEMRTLWLPVLRADMEIFENYGYTHEPPLSCPIIALGGKDDPRVSPAQLDAWRELTSAPTLVTQYTGGHFFVTPHQSEIVGQICASICGNGEDREGP